VLLTAVCASGAVRLDASKMSRDQKGSDSVLRAETGDCSHSSAAYYFRLGCREAEKSPHMEGWKPNSQHIRLAVTHTVVIKNRATFPPYTTFQHSGPRLVDGEACCIL
jgi:hypothetical protein